MWTLFLKVNYPTGLEKGKKMRRKGEEEEQRGRKEKEGETMWWNFKKDLHLIGVVESPSLELILVNN